MLRVAQLSPKHNVICMTGVANDLLRDPLLATNNAMPLLCCLVNRRFVANTAAGVIFFRRRILHYSEQLSGKSPISPRLQPCHLDTTTNQRIPAGMTSIPAQYVPSVTSMTVTIAMHACFLTIRTLSDLSYRNSRPYLTTYRARCITIKAHAGPLHASSIQNQ